MGARYTEFCDAIYKENNRSKAYIIGEQMIADRDPDTGKVCGSLSWEFYGKDNDRAFMYATKGSQYGDKDCLYCLANIYYDRLEFEKAYEYLIKAKEAGEDVSTVEKMYKERADGTWDKMIESRKNTYKSIRNVTIILTCVFLFLSIHELFTWDEHPLWIFGYFIIAGLVGGIGNAIAEQYK